MFGLLKITKVNISKALATIVSILKTYAKKPAKKAKIINLILLIT